MQTPIFANFESQWMCKVAKIARRIKKLDQPSVVAYNHQSDFSSKEISKLISLETLNVYLCENMESLFKLQLPSLKVSVIEYFRSLKSLQIHVQNLEVLHIQACHELELSEGLDNQILKLRLNLLNIQSLP